MSTIGIDLGTTTCEMAYVDNTGRPTTIVNFEGQLLTPSALLIEGRTVVVGEEAKRGASSAPLSFAECFKRSMGELSFPEPIDGRTYRPEMLSAMMLHRLRKDAERALGEVKQAVVTVPAYFDEKRRRATLDAGKITDLEIIDIINEPTAAALCYAHRMNQLGQTKSDVVERILVYDLGGGTFDTTILEVRSGREYRTIATDGEVRLGGYDWDERLRDHLAEQFQKKTNVNPLESAQGKVEFMRMAQQTKHSLTLREKVNSPCSFDGKRAVLEVTRDTFEKLTAELLDRTRTTTQMLIDDAKLTWQKIDKILLVGGSTRMPQVSRMIEGLTGRLPENSLSADESVAHGAAIYTQIRTSGIKVINVNAHSIRIAGKTSEGKPSTAVMIPKNSPLPFSKARLFPTQAGQERVAVPVYEGEADDPELCERMGKVRVSGLPTSSEQQGRVLVTLTCRKDGRVEVQASVRDPQDAEVELNKASAVLEPTHGMSDAEIQKARQELAGFEIV